jgi:hypothetical protein
VFFVIQKNVELECRITKKARGDRATGQDLVITFRLGVEHKQAIDHWRRTERDQPSRSEAIRGLIGQGLEVERKKREKSVATRSGLANGA